VGIQFDRLCRVDIGKANQQGISFDQNFKIEFDITKSITESTKYNTIRIYNLSSDTQKKLSDIIEENQYLISKGTSALLLNLYAGYAEDTGLEMLYIGNVINVSSKKQPPDIITEFTCAEAASNLKNNYISMGFNSGVTTKQIAQGFAENAGLSIDNTSYIPFDSFAHGYSASGTIKENLTKFLRQIGCHWTIEKNKILITKQGYASNDTVVELSADSGLIGSPERIDTSGNDSDTAKIKHGWKIKCLLRPQLLPARQIKIDSSFVKGIFIIDSVVHRGNTMDGDWTSEIEIKTGINA
jgi:hypothetical protein